MPYDPGHTHSAQFCEVPADPGSVPPPAPLLWGLPFCLFVVHGVVLCAHPVRCVSVFLLEVWPWTVEPFHPKQRLNKTEVN